MRYVVQFKPRVKNKRAVIESCGFSYVNNIFDDFELIEGNGDLEGLKTHNDVIIVEEDGICKQASDSVGEGQTIEYSINITKVKINAHDKGVKGDGIKVAVLDSGINFDHEDLPTPIACARILNGNIVSTNPNDCIDLNGHGTSVASVICMQDNDKGYLGVAPNVDLIIAKITNTDDGGSASHSDIAKGIIWAVDNGADVINISYSQKEYSSVVNTACQYAYAQGVSVVATAGNTGENASPYVNNWENYPGVIVVSGVVQDTHNVHNGKVVEMPKVIESPRFDSTKYIVGIYRSDLDRYTFLYSDKPFTKIFVSSEVKIHTNDNYFDRYNQFPKTSLNWDHNSIKSFIIYDSTMILFANHNIIDESTGLIYFPQNNIENMLEHMVANYGQYYPDYTPTKYGVVRSPKSSYGDGIDFAAPTRVMVATANGPNTYELSSYGTSFAAPFLAGQIALVRQRYPEYSIDEIYNFLKSNTINLGDSIYFGHGMVIMPNMAPSIYVSRLKRISIENGAIRFLPIA